MGTTLENATRARLRLELPYWDRMRGARDFRDFWRSVDNDRIYACQAYFEAATSRDLLIADADPADWDDFQRLLAAMGRAVQIINYAFDMLGVRYTGEDEKGKLRHVAPLQQWLEASASSTDNSVLLAVLGGIAAGLGRVTWFGKIDYPQPFPIDRLYQVKFIEPDESFLPSGSFDVFISYKHRKYFEEARTLHELVTARGLRCWLDQEEMGLAHQEWIEDAVLKRRLRAALQSSQLTVFFETVAEAIADEDFRGNHIAFNWQLFEQRHANRLLYVRPGYGVETYDHTGASQSFVSTEAFADHIAELIETPALSSRHDSRAQGDARDDSREAITEARKTLERLANVDFGRSIEISARTALIVLAPGEAESGGNERTPMADDVLINLLRYSPYAASRLHRAGLELEMLYAVGVKHVETLWRAPNDYRMHDLFGLPGGSQVPEAAQIAKSGTLDEVSLLNGLLEFACVHSYAQELFLRTFKNTDPSMESDEQVERIQHIADHVHGQLSRCGRPASGQVWTLTRDSSGFALRPLGVAEFVSVKGAEALPCRVFGVCLSQVHGVFDRTRIALLEQVLNDGADIGRLESVFAQYPTLEFTFDDASTLASTAMFQPHNDDDALSDLLLVPSDSFGTTSGKAEDISALSPAGKLAAAGERLVSLDDPTNESESASASTASLTDLRRRPAVLLGAGSIGEPGSEVPTISLFDLHCSRLAPLWRYQQLRNLDYDSF